MKFSKCLTTNTFLLMFLMLCTIWCKLSGVKTFLVLEERVRRKITDLENSKQKAHSRLEKYCHSYF
jgi:hypothetical protein